jgi:hypothetical protein
MKKLKTSEIKETRDNIVSKQLYRCAICKEDCSVDPVLDHDHKTGLIRAVLHRQCNAFLGRFENNAARHSVKREELAEFLRQAAAYIDEHSTDQTGLLHPTHYTAEEKLERAKAKRKRNKKRRDIQGV